MFTDEKLVLCEYKSQKGDSWIKLIGQASKYAENASSERTFVVMVKGIKIAFFLFKPDWHSSHNYNLKGKEFDGLLGLYADKNGVHIIPQANTLNPQMMMFDLYSKNKVDRYNINAVFSYMACLSGAPDIEDYQDDNGIDRFRLSSDKIDSNKLQKSRIIGELLSNDLKVNYKGKTNSHVF